MRQGKVTPWSSSPGAILAELSLTLGFFILPLMLLIISISWIGYYQLMADGLAFTAAHEESFGQSLNQTLPYAQTIYDPLHKLSLSTFGVHSPPISTLSGIPFGSSNSAARTGGQSIIAASQGSLQVNSPFAMKLFPASVSGLAIEPITQEFCPHFCTAGGGFSAATFAAGINYYTQGENSSPYYGGFQFMKTCNSMPIASWSALGTASNPLSPTENLLAKTDADSGRSWTTTCPNILWRSLGQAQYLSTQNYRYTSNGMAQGPGAETIPTPWGTFFTVWCHRRFYARIALTTMNVYPTKPANNTAADAFLASLFNEYNPYSYPTGTNGGGTVPAWHEAPGLLIYHIGSVATSGNDPGWDATDLGAANVFTRTSYEGNGNPSWGCDQYIGSPEL